MQTNDSSYIEKNEIIKASELYKEAVEKGHVISINNLGYCYQHGIGTEKNEIKAFELYKEAAEKGHIISINDLGYCYQHGVGTEKNEIKAFELYKEAYEKGNIDSKYNLGNCYKNGIGTEKNEIKAFELYKEVAEKGHAISINDLEKNEIKAFELYKEAAEKGHIVSINDLGYYQHGIEKNEIEISELAKNIRIIFRNRYLNGIGTKRNEIEAFELYKKAAKKGHVSSKYNLGNCYLNGIGTEKNEIEAFELYKKAAKKGHVISIYNLGNCYNNGVGTEKDEIKAFELYEKAAEKGHVISKYNLGNCYLNGIGTEKNEIKAFKSYEAVVAQNHHHIESICKLGYCYNNGIGTEKYEIRALGLYTKAAEKDHIFAQSELGMLYENGISITKDLKKAIYWYNKAANNGNKVAQYSLDICSFIIKTSKLNYSIELIPYSQITKFKRIAKGGFGVIYKALYNNSTVAIKKLLYSQSPSKYFLNELNSLYQCYDDKFECISKCYGITKDPRTKEFMFIMKYANGGNLHNYLQDNFNNITWKRKLYILWRISDGLQAIHEKNFIHRDFHSGNILVEITENINQYLIGDLGLSQPANISDNKICYGVIPYVAPEIFKGAAFSKASDIYSMGMIMWELTTGCKPFADVENHDVNLIYKIIDGKRPKITNDTPEDFANLMKKCWNPDPEKRPSAKKLCETFNSWLYTEELLFNQAEELRLELIKLEMLGPKFSEKSHSKAVYTSRPLSPLISGLFINSSLITSINMKQEHTISREYEFYINDIQREYEFDINDTQRKYELDNDIQREYEFDINDTQRKYELDNDIQREYELDINDSIQRCY